MLRIGIDLGGTKIEGIAINSDGEIAVRKRIDTPRGDYHQILHSIVSLVNDIAAGRNFTLGIGTPGAISPTTGLLRNSNTTELNGQPIQSDLQALLQQPIKISNDANCFALSEAVDGAAAGKDIVFGVIIGTGTGAGIAIHGRPLLGKNAIAGEWGHNPIPWPTEEEIPGPQCYCGKSGCIETFLSGPGFSHEFVRQSGNSIKAEQIVELAEQGDPGATIVVNKYIDRLARSLAHVINILDPDVIVLGGGMSNIQMLYTEVPKIWKNYVFSDAVTTQLIAPQHGDSSGVRGAAWLWNR